MKITEEIRRAKSMITGIRSLKTAAANVVNKNKTEYLAELEEAIKHLDKAIEILGRF